MEDDSIKADGALLDPRRRLLVEFIRLSRAPGRLLLMLGLCCVGIEAGLVLGFMVLRLASRPAALALLLARACCWLAANVLEHVDLASLHVDVALEEGLEMLGGTGLLLAAALYLLEGAEAFEEA